MYSGHSQSSPLLSLKGTDIQAAARTEQTEWLKKETFSGETSPFITDEEGAAKAVKIVLKEYSCEQTAEESIKAESAN